jgi:hypothetical protein
VTADEAPQQVGVASGKSAAHSVAQGHVVHPNAGAYDRQLPWMHTSFLPQALSQPPQCKGSLWKSTHAVVPFDPEHESFGQVSVADSQTPPLHC